MARDAGRSREAPDVVIDAAGRDRKAEEFSSGIRISPACRVGVAQEMQHVKAKR